jgi:PAS domain S-box-containing protein
MHDNGSPKVLIVDDQPRNLDVLEIMLEGTDCTLVRATSAEEALLAVVRHDFAALVLDIKMPGMNGLELASLIKQRKRSQNVPIVFLTAHSVDETDVLRGYGAGAVDYLSKPVNASILRSKIGVFVNAFRDARALVRLNEALQLEAAERERAQQSLRLANQELERRVQERTGALIRAHQGVRENEERLRMALEVAQIAAWEWHLPSGRMRWSTDAEALFGFPAGAFGPNLRIADAVHPDDRPRIDAVVAAAVATGVYEAEYRAVRPDGTVMWITERGSILPDADGERMVGISRDVTSERESAREREALLKREREARDEAEHQGRLKDEFLATLSHELRTPMNAMLGWLQILQSGKPIRDTQSVLSIINRNAQIQSKLIEDLLDMNRLISGNVRLEMNSVDIGHLVQTTILGLQPAADAKGVEVSALIAQPAEALADARRLQQVFWNLLHNAIKFTGEQGTVNLRVERADSDWRVVVADNGQGIAPTFLPHVFERFRQQDASSTRTVSGLGLGLSIAKQLVELHGGTINAHSPGEGHGATFTVRIPAMTRTRATTPILGVADLV